MINTLGLKSLRPISESRRVEEPGGSFISVLDVEPFYVSTACPSCGSDKLHKHGVRSQHYLDVPHFGEPTSLLIHRKRWRCTVCRSLFPDPLPEIDEKRRATTRLIDYVRKRSLIYTFSEVGREVGASDKTVKAIFDDYVEELESKYEFVTPKFLGIDEVKILGEYRCILTNIDKCTMYDLLPSRKLADLRKYFDQFKNPEQVEVFTADLWGPYAQIHKEYFPHAKMVADRFHVQRMATNAMEAVRKKVRKSLTQKERIKMKNDRFLLLKNASRLKESEVEVLAGILREFPEIEMAWETKEKFVDCWDHQNKEDAAKAFHEWAITVPEPMKPFFKEALSAWHNRQDDVLNYFDKRVTNAYTESINRLAKSINRMGRGYSLEVVRARMLYDEKALKKGAMVERTKVTEKIVEDDIDSMGNIGYADLMSRYTGPKTKTKTKVVEKVVYYGAHIPTLCDLLESGEFD